MSAEPTSESPTIEEPREGEPSLAEAASEQLRMTRDRVTLSRGIVLKLKPVPPNLIREISNRIPEPVVPIWHDPDKDREEPNPNDPDYIAAVNDRAIMILHNILEALMLMGTEVETLPPGVYGPDESGWLEDLEILGQTVDVSNSRRRYLAWMKFYALASELDIGLVQIGVSRLSGVTELEVMRAIRSFRNTEAR